MLRVIVRPLFAALLGIAGSGCALRGTSAYSTPAPVVRGQDSPLVPTRYAQHAAIPEAATPQPRTALQPITLREAVGLALQQSDVIRTLDGISPVTAYDPGIRTSEISAEIGGFAPELRLRYEGSQIDNPPSSFFGPGISTQTRYDEGEFVAGIHKRWPLGTTTRIAYDPSLGYLFFPNDSSTSTFNPSHEAAGVFEIRQPLLRGFGFRTNLAPIRIAQARRDQSQFAVEQVTIQQIRSVEEAYWDLHAAHVAWHAIQAVTPIAVESVRIEELRYQAERSTYADVARAKVKVEGLKRQAAGAQLRVIERDNRLRQLIGLDPDGVSLLLPIDTPRQDPAVVDLPQAIALALDRRPDLHQRRLEVEQLNWRTLVARNDLLPQLDARYIYRTNGLADRLDHALDQAATFDYSDWTVGLEFSIPIGNRPARSRLMAREQELSRERALLREYERQVGYDIALLAAELQTQFQQADSALRQVRETQEWLRLATIRYAHPTAGDTSRNVLLAALDDFQTALQAHVDSQSGAADALAGYNVAWAKLAAAQGVSLDVWQIEFASETAPAIQQLPASPPSPPQSAAPSPLASYRSVGFVPASVGAGHAGGFVNPSPVSTTTPVARPGSRYAP